MPLTPPLLYHHPDKGNNHTRSEDTEAVNDDSTTETDRSIFQTNLPDPPLISSPKSILRHRLHRKAIARQRKLNFVCIRPQTTTTPKIEQAQNTEYTNNGHTTGNASNYVPGTATTNGDLRNVGERSTNMSEQNLGKLYNELIKSCTEYCVVKVIRIKQNCWIKHCFLLNR